jgi:Glycosyltransferase family 87/WD40-like Beta Propeller Repeat
MKPLLESRHCRKAPNAQARNLGLTPSVEREGRGWLPRAEWWVVAVLALVFVGHSFLPAWQSLQSEFPDYYLAAELYHQGFPLDRVYEWTWFQRQNDHWGVRDGLVSFAPNPPTSVLPLLPLTRFRPLAAKRIWLVLSVVFLALSLWVLRQVTSLSWRRLILISLLSVLPLSVDFLFARPYVFLLLLICTAYYAACRDSPWLTGAIWSAAAAMKLFPALSILLFIGTRKWRALGGFLAGAAALLAISVVLFGVEVHRVFLGEVLSQASRGDWLGPYVLTQNSFITLWSHLFLFEPELNAFPWINSPFLYALAMAITVTVSVLAFVCSISGDKTPEGRALHWATLVPLLLLLSTTTAPDHSLLLIFTAIIGFDIFLGTGNDKKAVTLLLLYVAACAPVPTGISNWFPLSRLASTTALYALLLSTTRSGRGKLPMTRWLAAGLTSVAVLTLYNFHAVQNRAEDFSRRLPTPRHGYRFADPVPVADEVAFTEMQPSKYAAVLLTRGTFQEITMPGDALSVAGTEASNLLYSEVTGRKSFIVRLPVDQLGSAPQTLTEGQQPALSSNGKWLAFIREEQGRGTVWLLATDSGDAPEAVLASTFRPLEVTVTDDGDVIAAAGTVSDPHLLLVRRATQEVAALPSFPHPARYPSISPDGKRLAFSRRDRGSWHLVVRTLATEYEQQLTHASCNSISPAWANAQTVLYATDCGRGVGLSAVARVVLPN